VLLLAAVFGILSAVLIFAFLKSNGGSSGEVNEAINAGAGAESVVVLATDVSAGTTITNAMLDTRTVPVSALLPGHSTKTEDFVGKVAIQSMFAGEQVISAKVTDFDSEPTLSYQVPAGMRALGITVPHESWIIGGLPQPGDRVDVVGITAFRSIDPLTGEERPELISGIIAQDVEVLALGQTLVRRIPASDGTSTIAASDGAAGGETAAGEENADGDTREGVVSVTLALTPELAAKVALIDAMEDNEGQWRIIARRKGEDTPIEGTATWSLDDIFTFKD
jgi:pilus assembly protein CpaB